MLVNRHSLGNLLGWSCCGGGGYLRRSHGSLVGTGHLGLLYLVSHQYVGDTLQRVIIRCRAPTAGFFRSVFHHSCRPWRAPGAEKIGVVRYYASSLGRFVSRIPPAVYCNSQLVRYYSPRPWAGKIYASSLGRFVNRIPRQFTVTLSR